MPMIFSSGLSFPKSCRFYLLRVAHDPLGVISEYDLRFRSRFILPDQVVKRLSLPTDCVCVVAQNHMGICVWNSVWGLCCLLGTVSIHLLGSLNLSVGRSSVSEVQNFSEEVFCLLAQPQTSANILRGKIRKHSSLPKALVNSLSRYLPGSLRKTEPLKPYGGQLLNPRVLASLTWVVLRDGRVIKGRLAVGRAVHKQVYLELRPGEEPTWQENINAMLLCPPVWPTQRERFQRGLTCSRPSLLPLQASSQATAALFGTALGQKAQQWG